MSVRARIVSPALLLLAVAVTLPLLGGGTQPIDLRNLGAPSFESFSSRDGLPDGVITVIDVDGQGFAWAASPRGLYRFLGHRWQREVGPETAGQVHRRMLLDAGGTLWLPANDGGIGRHRDGRWRFAPRAAGLTSDQNYRVSQLRDSAGRLRTWLLTFDAGLFELVGDAWRPDPGNASLPPSGLISMGSTARLFGEPRQWIGTGEHGIWFRREGEVEWQQFHFEGIAPGQVEDLQRSVDGSGESLWISIFGQGVFRIGEQESRNWSVETGALRSNQVYAITIAEEPEGETTAWITSRDGLVRIRGTEARIFDRRHGLPSDQVRGTKLWRSPGGEDILWIATESGVARAVFTDDRWRTASLMGSGAIGVFGVLIEPDVEPEVEPDGGDGERLWVASSRDGLGLYENGTWRTFSAATGHLSGNSLRMVERAPDLRGALTVWTGVEGGHLFRIDENLRFREVATPWPKRAGQEVMDVLARQDEGSRELWFATRAGVFRWRDDGWTEVPAPAYAEEWRTTALLEQIDGDGRSWLWATSNQGLTRLDGSVWTLLDIPGLPRRNLIGLTLIKSPEGRQVLWIGSSFDGLIRLDVSDPLHPIVLQRDELPPPIDVTVYSALADSKGRVYLCTNDGVQQLTPAASGGWNERIFRRRDGMVHEECNTNAQFIDPHDRFWTGTLGGLTVFDPGPSQPASPRRLRLVSVRIDDRPAEWGAAALGGELVLQPGMRNLQAEFTLQSWQREEETRYRTRLIGFDAEPGPWTAQPSRTLTALPPGSYTLRVEARDYAGIEAAPLELPFEVVPSWWQRTPVQGGFVFGAVLLTFATANWRTRSLRAQKERLEREVAARTQELHVANSRLRELSYTDALTGLPNRRRMLETLDAQIDSREGAAPPSCSLVFIDVDRFKAYNDRLGHPAGDEALRSVAASLQAHAPASALVARYGGEEFACVLPDHPLQEAVALAERMRADMESRPIPVPGSVASEHVTISAGVAAATLRSETDIHALLRNADAALYRAKDGGRNCVRT